MNSLKKEGKKQDKIHRKCLASSRQPLEGGWSDSSRGKNTMGRTFLFSVVHGRHFTAPKFNFFPPSSSELISLLELLNFIRSLSWMRASDLIFFPLLLLLLLFFLFYEGGFESGSGSLSSFWKRLRQSATTIELLPPKSLGQNKKLKKKTTKRKTGKFEAIKSSLGSAVTVLLQLGE